MRVFNIILLRLMCRCTSKNVQCAWHCLMMRSPVAADLFPSNTNTNCFMILLRLHLQWVPHLETRFPYGKLYFPKFNIQSDWLNQNAHCNRLLTGIVVLFTYITFSQFKPLITYSITMNFPRVSSNFFLSFHRVYIFHSCIICESSILHIHFKMTGITSTAKYLSIKDYCFPKKVYSANKTRQRGEKNNKTETYFHIKYCMNAEGIKYYGIPLQ